jgi:hypothetical protein
MGSIPGDIAQLVEHLLCKQGVTGSNPVVSIIPGPRQRMCSRSECKGIIPRMGVARSDTSFERISVRIDRLSTPHCIARKGHEIVALSFFNKNGPPTLVPVQSADFVLCQGESGSGASLGACDGSGFAPCSSRCPVDV